MTAHKLTERERFVLGWVGSGTITSWDGNLKETFASKFGGKSWTAGERIQRILCLLEDLRLLECVKERPAKTYVMTDRGIEALTQFQS